MVIGYTGVYCMSNLPANNSGIVFKKPGMGTCYYLRNDAHTFAITLFLGGHLLSCHRERIMTLAIQIHSPITLPLQKPWG